jgi:two-component system nitrogen regulation response regulator GlnG
MKIFIVDDDPSLRHFVEALLASDPQHEVRTFETGAAAVAALAQPPPPGLVLSDLDMPGVAGEDVARAAARLPDPPRIVLMSGDPDRLRDARALAEAVLHKPFAITELMALIRPPHPAEGD